MSAMAATVSPQVSVVIPTFNHARFLAGAIQSVLLQTFGDFEIVIIDDGSTDETPMVAASLRDPRIRYIRQENHGLAAARNRGILSSRSDLIALLDADDLFEPGFLSAAVSVLRADKSIDAVYTGYRCVDQENLELPEFSTRTVPPDALYEELLGGNFLVPSSVVVRSGCYRQTGPFDESFKACEDWDMWLRIAKIHRVAAIPKALVRYRIVSTSMSTDSERMTRARMQIAEKYAAQAPPHRATGLVASVQLRECVDHLTRLDEDAALRSLRCAAEAHPGLLCEKSLFYELAFSSEPRGTRGDFARLDLNNACGKIIRLMDGLGSLANESAWAAAHMSMAELSHGCSNGAAVRRHLGRAFHYGRHRVVRAGFFSIWVKSFLPIRILGLLRTLRAAQSPS